MDLNQTLKSVSYRTKKKSKRLVRVQLKLATPSEYINQKKITGLQNNEKNPKIN